MIAFSDVRCFWASFSGKKYFMFSSASLIVASFRFCKKSGSWSVWVNEARKSFSVGNGKAFTTFGKSLEKIA